MRESTTAAKASILVVDDEESVLTVVRSVLERAGYAVLVASNGLAAMNILKKEKCDLVLTDIVMPEQEGIETFQKIKHTYPDMKVIAMSGVPSRLDYLHLAHRLGANGTLEKPFTSNELLTLLKNTLTS